MKNYILILLFIVCSISCFAQIQFEEGYFVNNDGKRTECFIKNQDWRSNPSHFEYKLKKEGEVKTTSVKEVKSFGIDGFSKYIRATVKIDRSKKSSGNLSSKERPEFKKETLFLETLIKGDASLYAYQEKGNKWFFYEFKNYGIKQLVYKKFSESRNIVGTNKSYKRQLSALINCDDFSFKNIKHTGYYKSDLVRFFIDYHDCNEFEYQNYYEKRRSHSSQFHVWFRPGLNVSSLTTNHDLSNYRDLDIENITGYRLGFEFEFILPFHRNKWAITLEPTYQSYMTRNLQEEEGVNINYNSFQLPLGLRHYFYILPRSALFLNANIMIDMPVNSNIERLEVKSGNNFSIGAGYSYNKRFSIAFDYGFDRGLLYDYIFWRSDFDIYSVTLGINIFE